MFLAAKTTVGDDFIKIHFESSYHCSKINGAIKFKCSSLEPFPFGKWLRLSDEWRDTNCLESYFQIEIFGRLRRPENFRFLSSDWAISGDKTITNKPKFRTPSAARKLWVFTPSKHRFLDVLQNSCRNPKIWDPLRLTENPTWFREILARGFSVVISLHHGFHDLTRVFVDVCDTISVSNRFTVDIQMS